MCTLPQLLPDLDALFHGIRKIQVLAIPEFKKLILIFPLDLFVEIKPLDRLVFFLILTGFINSVPVPINCKGIPGFPKICMIQDGKGDHDARREHIQRQFRHDTEIIISRSQLFSLIHRQFQQFFQILKQCCSILRVFNGHRLVQIVHFCLVEGTRDLPTLSNDILC